MAWTSTSKGRGARGWRARPAIPVSSCASRRATASPLVSVSHSHGGTGRPGRKAKSVALLEPGRVLSHYRIVEKLGQGGQATAYKAEDLRLSRMVVVKILRSELAQSEAAKRRFEREA